MNCATPTTTSESGPHLVLYDGQCGLCHGLVRFVLQRDPRGQFHFAALQSAAAARLLAPTGGLPNTLTTLYVLPDYRQSHAGTCHIKARGALFILRRLGWPWRSAAWWLGALPAPWLDWGYERIARNRHRFLGPRQTCFRPNPEHRGRFLDTDSDPRPGL